MEKGCFGSGEKFSRRSRARSGFSIKVILFLFLNIWVRAAFPRYRYDQLMGLGRKVFLPLSLARVVPVSGVLVTF
ncbi:hypothetical protein ES288_A03G164300v1 [Gossypium darwinii]|uniref:Uncharacterized protein n=1 Tax=Gossypium darwinii TaxID=34276 RepID=A0A5D2H5U6_GOSDA|nr:hypothetical protein ES288_A03G164300v1 [Gossypium darwinii]